MVRQTARATPILAVAVVVSIVAGACDGNDAAEPSTTSSATVIPSSSVPPTTRVSTATTTTTTAPAGISTTLPGDPLDFGPNSGDVLGVVAIAFDDVLNLRAGPGTDFDVLKKLAPRADRVISNGRAQSLPNSIWYEVTAAGVTGWVSATYLAHFGATDDITAQVVTTLGETPRAATMEALGQIVADTYPDDERRLRVRMSGVPSVGDLGEVIYDVVGFADDAVQGLRLHVFGRAGGSGDSFTLETVEATTLCARGVTDDGLCV